jgi:hypothetical protein
VFCSRCGAEQTESARFCERCGHRLEFDDPGAATDSAAPAPPERAKPDPRLIGGAVALTLVVAAGAVLVLTGTFSSSDGTDTAAAPVSTATRSTTATPAPPAITTQAPDTSPDAATDTDAATQRVQPAGATVKRTCGRNGVGGDCHLSIRAQPATGAREVKRLDEGDSLRLSCQVHGARVFSSALGDSSTVWSKTTDGGYVSNAYVAGPRLSARRITLREC